MRGLIRDSDHFITQASPDIVPPAPYNLIFYASFYDTEDHPDTFEDRKSEI